MQPTLWLLISCSGTPSRAIRMAGARISSMVTLPEPNSWTVLTQPAAAPGQVTELMSVRGI